MNLYLQLGVIVVGFGVIVALLRRKRVDPWETCRPLSNLERELRWIDRHAPPWAADDRKQQALRKRRRDNALDQRVATQLERARRAA